MPYVTERLTLRPLTLDDAEALYSYRSLPDVNTFTYTPVWTSLADAHAHLEKHVPNMKPEHFQGWLILRNDTGEAIGDVFLDAHSELQGSFEIGFIIRPDHAGKGYATEAAREAMRIGFEDWDVHRIFARVDEENVGSVRVCERLNMRQEARLIENDRNPMRGNAWSTELVFALLDREWEGKEL